MHPIYNMEENRMSVVHSICLTLLGGDNDDSQSCCVWISWLVGLGVPALLSEDELSSSELSSIVSSKVILGGRSTVWGRDNFRSPFLLMWVHDQSVEQSQALPPPPPPPSEIYSCMALRSSNLLGKRCAVGVLLTTLVCVLIFILRMFCFFYIFKGHIWAVFFNSRPWTICGIN